ncbi:MAG: hypothetical protein M3Q48_05615 [Actinomycetota bacterium]|nr:hypothetical protein [Actinomycetota bacterium]HSH22476.1 hypothetical protein [Acidimicrobiales bacterium]
MGANAALLTPSLTVDPGQEVTLQVRLQNRGRVVDEFTCDVVGAAAAWAFPEPASLSLFPDAEGTVVVHFRPPRSPGTSAGEVPFGVRITSREDPDGMVVEEGTIEVGAFQDCWADVRPRTARGRRVARQTVTVHNRGNVTLRGSLSGVDAENQLDVAFRPASVVVEPGTAMEVRALIRPRARFFVGPPKPHPYQVVVSTEHQPLVVDTSMVQGPLLPPWTPKALLALLALLLVLLVAWLTLVRPTLESAAKDAAQEAVAEPVAETKAQADDATKAAAAAKETAAAVEEKAAKVDAKVPDGATLPPDGGLQAGSSTQPFDRRLQSNVLAGKDGPPVSFTVPAGQRLAISDILLQNPKGDSGTLRIQRDNDVLLEVALQNFRDLDYHLVSPVRLEAGQKLTLLVLGCQSAAPGDRCTPAAYFAGSTTKV